MGLKPDLILKTVFLITAMASLAYAKDKDITVIIVETTEERFLSPTPAPTGTYSAKIILPDGTHAKLICFLYVEGCGSITPWTPPEKTTPAVCQSPDAATSICTRKNIGNYRAKRKGDDLLIYTRKGTVKYQIAEGQWQ
jgi:hypothetical protein